MGTQPFGKLFVCMEPTGRVQEPIRSRLASRMNPLNVLEDEASRVDFRQVNGVQHARRVVTRFQNVVNSKPTVSHCLLPLCHSFM